MKMKMKGNTLFTKVGILIMILIMTVEVPVQAYAAGGQTHTYYTGIPAEAAALADAVAQNIAVSIMSNPSYATDLQRVSAAAAAVASYASTGVYGRDINKYYRSPYGVFVSGNYTCAGTTRALGRVLDYMGYTYTHANENQNSHQWNVIIMDGQIGYADGMAGFAGYGQYQSGMTLPNGSVVYFY